MKTIDLNADIGEADNPATHPEWAQAEVDILEHISSANIACGGHAGNKEAMRWTVRNALDKGVTIGAHPAYPDRKNFGRKSLSLGEDIEPKALAQSLTQQILTLSMIAMSEGGRIKYVKPHGALYNDAVSDLEKAELIAAVIHGIDANLILLGSPNSKMEKAAQTYGLSFIAEGFIDRRYTDDGHLQNRAIDGAVIQDNAHRLAQAHSLATSGEVTTTSGQTLKLSPQSLCVHGDSLGAVNTAKLARAALEKEGLTIRAFAS